MSIARVFDREAASNAFVHAIGTDAQKPASFFLSRLLGFDFSYPDGTCVVEFDVRDFMFNPQGSLHGGVISLAMDASMGHLLYHLQAVGTTLELKTQFLRPVTSGRVKAVGRMIRRGRSICFMQSEFVGEDGELSAYATSTWKLTR